MKKEKSEKKKGGCLKIALIAVVIIVILGIISTMGNGDDGKKETKVQTQEETKTEANADSAPESIASTNAEENIPTEYKSALKRAKSYSDTMYMSKAGIYNQLTSEYGEQFTPEAAQYAIDNLDADWNTNALKKSRKLQRHNVYVQSWYLRPISF